jgi:hypothetical protein
MIERLLLSTSISPSQLQKINQNDPDPKSMAECKKRSDWNQWKDAIQAELASPKEKYSVNQYLHLVESLLWDSNGLLSENEMRTMRL